LKLKVVWCGGPSDVVVSTEPLLVRLDSRLAGMMLFFLRPERVAERVSARRRAGRIRERTDVRDRVRL